MLDTQKKSRRPRRGIAPRLLGTAAVAAALAIAAAPTAAAAPEEIYVPTGLVSPQGALDGAGSVAFVEGAWPVYADVLFPAARPLLQGLADVATLALGSVETSANSLPAPLADLVPGFLR